MLRERLEREGIHDDMRKLRKLQNTWLLLDDAQNSYDKQYDPFWQFVVKSISAAGVGGNLFVVIA